MPPAVLGLRPMFVLFRPIAALEPAGARDCSVEEELAKLAELPALSRRSWETLDRLSACREKLLCVRVRRETDSSATEEL